jgi:hypothetical protein
MKSIFTSLAALLVFGALTGAALASGGGGGGGGGGAGGGGGTKPVLPAPPIAPGTFDGIGPGPVYVHESFGSAQRTRYAQNGSIVDVLQKPEVNGIRAEFPNNKTESWLSATAGPSWKFTTVGPADPFEPVTPLQDSEFGVQDGLLFLVGTELGAPDTRPAALIPFAAPASTAVTVSGDTVAFFGSTAIGFSTSSATTRNFETSGQAWLELDARGYFPPGGDTNVGVWTFHAGSTTLSGTYDRDATGFNQMAVTVDPVTRVATATLDGQTIASAPYAGQVIKYAGVEGTMFANVDNFTIQAQ